MRTARSVVKMMHHQKKWMSLLLTIVLCVGLVPAMAIAADRGEWAPYVTYATNDTATYGGKTYQAIQGHTSLPGWEPSNVPALWRITQGTPDTEAPTAPSNLRSTAVTSTSVSLAWNASTDNVGVNQYVIYQGATQLAAVSGSTLSYIASSLTANTAYTFTVKAKDAAGNLSPASNALSVTTSGTGGGNDVEAPTAPSSLAVTGVTASSVSLAWTASTDNVGVTGYDVYVGTTLKQSVTGTTATVAGLAAATSYTFKVTAKDAAGNVSAPSNTVTATTSTTGGGGQLPKHTLTGYWHNFINGSSNLKLSDVPSEYDIIALSFAEMDLSKPGGVIFAVNGPLSTALGGYTDNDLISDIQAKRAQGKKVILSIGGELGNVNLNSASPNVANFVNSMYDIITRFGLDGVDIDLENGMNVPNLTTAIRQLQQMVGPNFILTMAPQTIDMQNQNTSYMQLYGNLKDITTVINVQYYNSGCMLGRDGKCYSQGTIDFLTALTDLTLQWVEPSQLGLGLPAVSSAAGGGYVQPSVVGNALKCLTSGTNCGTYTPVAQYPDLRGAMTWSINWDKTSNYNYAKTVKPVLNTLP